MKKIFTLFAALAMVMSMSAKTIYLKPNSNWTKDRAWFAVCLCNGSEAPNWHKMTKSTADPSLYQVEIADAKLDKTKNKNIIFVRMNPAKTALGWDSKWNQTGDLDITKLATNNCCAINSGQWDCGSNVTWSTYTLPTFYIAGDFVTPNWDPGAAANKMDYADGVYSKSYNNVAASAHQFKITNGTWDNAIGYNKNTCSGTNCDVKENGGNIQFTPLTEGTVTITYTLADGKVHITCPEPPVAEFNITYPATQTNYTLVAGPAKAQTSAEVSFTATPAEGYVLNVTYNGNVITGENNVYTFIMPASDVTIAITAVAATTLYYVDHNNWGNVNAYMWDNNGNNGWPGAAMTSVGTVGDNAYSYYSISFAQGAYTSIIFNNGSGSQTGDLTINTAKPYFYDGAWYTWDELLAKLAAPVVTYDYYITGSFNGNNPKKAENGMTLDGTVYKATVTLAAGDNTLKVTDGTWDKTWGANELGAAYEEVSNPNDYNNIKITLAAEKEITVIFDATAGKITFEGLTQIHTVKATVNPAEAGTIKGLAADGKYNHGAEATLTANPAEGYEFTCWTSGEDTVSTANPYTFPVTADVALVANFKKAVEEHTITLSGFLKYTNDWREYTTLQNNVEGDTAFFVYNYVDGVPAYGEDYTVTANLGELTIKGTGSWKLIDELETITAVLYNEEGTAVYNVTVSAKAPEVHNLACTDALYVENITAWRSELIITGVIDEDALKISVYDWQEATAGTYNQVMGVLNDEVYIQPESAVVTIVDTKLTIVFSAKDELGNTYNVNVTATPKPNTPLVVENATFTVDGDNLTIQGQWETKSVVVALEGWSTTKYGEYNNAVLMTGTGDAEDDIYAEFSAVLSKDGTTATLTGVAANWDGTKYDVTISGLAPAENPTALDNVDTAVAPAKVINNGQLIIIRNGVQYNAQGAVVK